GVAYPPAIGRSGAGAWRTVPQVRQPYLGRQIRMTRSCAGTQSSISLTLSPIGCQRAAAARAGRRADIDSDLFTWQMIGERLAPRLPVLRFGRRLLRCFGTGLVGL